MRQFVFNCVYGSNHTQDTEELTDLDTFTWSAPIRSLEELINAVDDDN